MGRIDCAVLVRSARSKSGTVESGGTPAPRRAATGRGTPREGARATRCTSATTHTRANRQPAALGGPAVRRLRVGDARRRQVLRRVWTNVLNRLRAVRCREQRWCSLLQQVRRHTRQRTRSDAEGGGGHLGPDRFAPDRFGADIRKTCKVDPASRVSSVWNDQPRGCVSVHELPRHPRDADVDMRVHHNQSNPEDALQQLRDMEP